jgi:hypothetical protein
VAVVIDVLWRNSATVLWVALGVGAMLAAVSVIAGVPQANEHSLF